MYAGVSMSVYSAILPGPSMAPVPAKPTAEAKHRWRAGQWL